MENLASQVTSLAGQVSSRFEQIRRDLIANQQLIATVNQKVDTIELQQESINTSHSSNLIASTAQLMSELATRQNRTQVQLGGLKSELTSAYNRTQLELAKLNISLQVQCRQHSMAALQDSLEAHTYQSNSTQSTATEHLKAIVSKLDRITTDRCHQSTLKAVQASLTTHTTQTATTISQLSTRHTALQNTVTGQFQTVNSKLNSITATQCQQRSLSAHISQTAADRRSLTAGHATLQNTLTGQHQTVCSKLNSVSTNLLQGQRNMQKELRDGIPGFKGYSCGGSHGWRRVAFLNMNNSTHVCPPAWNLTRYSIRTCGRKSSGPSSCDSMTFPAAGGKYRQVCGRAKGYQYGIAWGFSHAIYYHSPIDHCYVDGLSITHGASPRKHIWTFATGNAQYSSGYGTTNPHLFCKCDLQSQAGKQRATPPSYVGTDYSCESGVRRWVDSSYYYRFFSGNALWDGHNCGLSNTCCSQKNPSYFVKNLPSPTSDDVEVRLCSGYLAGSADIAVNELELYVK